MRKSLRQQVFNKYGGLCAYTGKPLGDSWEIDHIEPLNRKYKSVGGHHVNNDGNPATLEDFVSGNCKWVARKIVADGYSNPERDIFDNMAPAIKIINHYKRCKSLELFRSFMLRFHIRLSKLPKNTTVTRAERRKEYMLKVAELFDITPDKPFDGKFYFEKSNPLQTP